jgi:hypothetical protein
MSVYCKGKCCTGYEIIREGRAFYSNGGKYCRTCSRYMKIDSIRCPCCKQRVSHGTRFKTEKYRVRKSVLSLK